MFQMPRLTLSKTMHVLSHPRQMSPSDSSRVKLFEDGGGSRLIRQALAAEVLMTGAYEARSRETCMRVLGSLQLPPKARLRILIEICCHIYIL
jgi:hypothetical protein